MTGDAIVSFSGGKDSTAMLLRMLEINDDEQYPVDRILFADTDFEFPELYEYIKTVQKYLDDNYPERGLVIEHVRSKKSWEHWFFGRVTSGKNKGVVRGPPLIAYPCYWAREAKLYPLQRATKGCSIKYVGIALDEARRVSKHAEEQRIRYPLIEWGWTEEDAFKYLDKLNMVNPLYVNFTRLGCFHCIKQPTSSWYVLWAKYPELWAKAKEWDEKGYEVADRGLARYDSLAEMEEKFTNGFVPEGKRPFECNSCDAVSMFHDADQKGIIDEFGGEESEDLAIQCDIMEVTNAKFRSDFKWVKKDEAEPQEWWPE